MNVQALWDVMKSERNLYCNGPKPSADINFVRKLL